MLDVKQKIWLIKESVWYTESFLTQAESDHIFAHFHGGIDWTQHTIQLFGKQVACPRLSAWYGDAGAGYTYSGITLSPDPWTPELWDLKLRVESEVSVRFNSVLLNLYRNGSDSMGWHADDEKELGLDPVIASVSLGATRRFRLKPVPPKSMDANQEGNVENELDTPSTVSVDLAHGSLLVMLGPCQSRWKHALPKTARNVGPRINLTFRTILES